MEGRDRIPVNHTSWVAEVTLTDRPKSVRNRCLIELFGALFVLFVFSLVHNLRRVRGSTYFIASGEKIVKRIRRRQYDPGIIVKTLPIYSHVHTLP